MAENRRKNGQFANGNCANPGGRPKKDPKMARVLKVASPRAARRLVALIASDDERIALKACSEILDRVLGKAETMSKVELNARNSRPVETGRNVDLSRWSDEDLNLLWELYKKYNPEETV